MTSKPLFKVPTAHKQLRRDLEEGFDAGVASGDRVAQPVHRTRTAMDDLNSEWQRKAATLSDKTAQNEFGLTQDEIVQAIRDGQLQYREGSRHGNPWLRLLRREVEALIKMKHGDDYLQNRQAKTELARVNRELKQLKTRVAALEKRKSQLIAELGQ